MPKPIEVKIGCWRFLKSKQYWIDELRSFFVTLFAIFAVDAGALLLQLYNGDVSQTVLWGLVAAFGRSAIKAALTLAFPMLFPVRTSK